MEVSVIVGKLNEFIIGPILLLLFTLGFLYFLWGVATFIWNSESEEGRKTGTKHMIWGIIGMFIMAAASGIVKLIDNTFGL